MPLDRQALIAYMQKQIENERADLGKQGMAELLDRGKQWQLGAKLRAGGSVLFPHAVLQDCGHQIAAAAQACLDSGAERVIALGVLHALSDCPESPNCKRLFRMARSSLRRPMRFITELAMTIRPSAPSIPTKAD